MAEHKPEKKKDVLGKDVLIIWEERERDPMDLKVQKIRSPRVTEVVLPPLTRKGVALIGITTLDDPSTSFWGQLMLAKYPDGRPVFQVLMYRLVCDACRLAGVETTCKHKLGDLP